jgi:hypothetical protein
MRRSQSLRQTRLLTVLSMLLVVSAACGRVGSASESEEVACTVAGSTRFSTTYLGGPVSSRDEFTETEIGRSLEGFFTDGDGAPEDFLYLEAEGFSVVTSVSPFVTHPSPSTSMGKVMASVSMGRTGCQRYVTRSPDTRFG